MPTAAEQERQWGNEYRGCREGWRCPAGHTWPSGRRTKFSGLCPACLVACRGCKSLRTQATYIVGSRLLQTCPECRQGASNKRRAPSPSASRAVCPVDDMDDDVLCSVLMKAFRMVKCRDVRLTARLVCRKMERVLFADATERLGLPAAREDVVWFMSGLEVPARGPVAMSNSMLLPPELLDGRPASAADGVREVIRLYGSGRAMAAVRSQLGGGSRHELTAHVLTRDIARALGRRIRADGSVGALSALLAG
jgi:hypothetical protein